LKRRQSSRTKATSGEKIWKDCQYEEKEPCRREYGSQRLWFAMRGGILDRPTAKGTGQSDAPDKRGYD